jgi:hypothetical protein
LKSPQSLLSPHLTSLATSSLDDGSIEEKRSDKKKREVAGRLCDKKIQDFEKAEKPD